jgi:mRNA-degrading endonuclease RelE of RelBE toxin-antitoxin system
MEKYPYRPSEAFADKLDDIRKIDPKGYTRIQQVIDRLLVNPGDADGKMHGRYHGKLKKYVGRKDYRLIYDWCELCRKENRRLISACEHCESLPDQSLIFFDLYHKKESKRV